MLDLLDDVVDDIQAIFGVDDPLSLPGPRFFRHAQRLPCRGGAVAHVLTRELQLEGGGEVEQAVHQPAAAAVEGTADEVAAIAAMSQNADGFPSIGYAS